MNTVLCVAVALVTLCCYAEAGQNFPPEAQYLTKQIFNKINPAMEEDWTDYMQDLAGEFTTCEEIFVHQGHWELKGKRAPNQRDRVGALIDYVAWETTDRQGIDAIAKRTFEKWIETFPFDAQIREATNYGCSVAPGCPPTNRNGVVAPTGYAVVGCGFYPDCKNEGCVADAPPPTQPPPPRFDVRALAFTEEQYSVAESLFYGKRWDRSHLLEDISGTETDCSMIGQSSWQFSNALSMARSRGLDVYGRFGYTPHTGNTPDPMVKVLREISDAERLASSNQVSGSQFGCSIIPDCFSRVGASRNEMYVVVSCLFSRTEISQNPSPFGRQTRPQPRPESRPQPRPESRPFPRPESRPFPRPSQDNVNEAGAQTRPFPRPDPYRREQRPFPRPDEPQTRPFPRPDEPETRPFPRPDEPERRSEFLPAGGDPRYNSNQPETRPEFLPAGGDPRYNSNQPETRPEFLPAGGDPRYNSNQPETRPEFLPAGGDPRYNSNQPDRRPEFLPAGGDPRYQPTGGDRLQPVDRDSSLIQPNFVPEGGRQPVKPLPNRPDGRHDGRHLPARSEGGRQPVKPLPNRPDERTDGRHDGRHLPARPEGGRQPVKPLPNRPDERTDGRHDGRHLPARPDRAQGEFLPAQPIRGDQGNQAEEEEQTFFFW